MGHGQNYASFCFHAKAKCNRVYLVPLSLSIAHPRCLSTIELSQPLIISLVLTPATILTLHADIKPKPNSSSPPLLPSPPRPPNPQTPPPAPPPLNVPPSRARRQLAARLALHSQQKSHPDADADPEDASSPTSNPSQTSPIKSIYFPPTPTDDTHPQNDTSQITNTTTTLPSLDEADGEEVPLAVHDHDLLHDSGDDHILAPEDRELHQGEDEDDTTTFGTPLHASPRTHPRDSGNDIDEILLRESNTSPTPHTSAPLSSTSNPSTPSTPSKTSTSSAPSVPSPPTFPEPAHTSPESGSLGLGKGKGKRLSSGFGGNLGSPGQRRPHLDLEDFANSPAAEGEGDEDGGRGFGVDGVGGVGEES